MKISLHSKNMLAIFGGDSLAKVLGFLVTAYLARTLGDVAFGSIHIAMAALSYAIIVSTGGIPLFGTREIARSTQNLSRFTGELLTTRLLLSLIAMAALMAYAFFLQTDPSIRKLTLIFSLFLLPNGAFLDWYFQGKSQMGTVATGRTLQMIVYLLLVILLVSASDDVVWVAWAWVAGAAVNMLWLGWRFFRNGFAISPPSSATALTGIWRSSLPLGLATILSQLVLQLPFFYLDRLNKPGIAGQYGAAFRLMLALLVIDRIFYTVFYPAISRISDKTDGEISEVVEHTLRIVTFFAVAIATLAALSSSLIIPIIYSSEYSPAIPLFQLLCLFFLGSFVNSVVGFTLAGTGNQRAYSQSYGIAFVICMLTGVWLTYWQGINGMILALGGYQLVALLASSIFLRQTLAIHWYRTLFLPLILGCAAIAFLFLHSQNGILIWGMFFLIYLPVLLWAGKFSKKDREFLKRILL